MTETARTWHLLRIALVIAGLIVLFFSGIFPFENYLASVTPVQLTASVVGSDVAILTNQNRVENGLARLSVSPLLTQAAQLKAEDMAQNSYYAHISPDGKSPLYWLQRVGYKYLNAGENLVIDRNTSEAAVTAWMNSTDHRENILRPQFTEIGVGVAEGTYEGQETIYVVQEFGTPYPLSSPALRTPAKPVVAIEPLPLTQLVTDIQALAAPVVHAIAPATAPKTASTKLAVSEAKKPLAQIRTAVLAKLTATSTPNIPSSASSTAPVATTSTPTFSYALAPEFYKTVQFAQVHEQIGPVLPDTVPGTQNPTPNWLLSLHQYLGHIIGSIPRIW